MSILRVDQIQHSTGTAALTIDSSGRVLSPNKPAFRAGRSSAYSPGADVDIIFNDTTAANTHFNDGGHYNSTNGRFTAPVTGKYFITSCIIWEQVTSSQVMTDAFSIRVNGVLHTYSFRRAYYVNLSTGDGGYYVDHSNAIVSLNVNDYVTIRNSRNLVVHGNTRYCHFSGFLL
jgi:hypothetical protein